MPELHNIFAKFLIIFSLPLSRIEGETGSSCITVLRLLLLLERRRSLLGAGTKSEQDTFQPAALVIDNMMVGDI